MCENDKSPKGQIEWVLDRGCTDHIINSDEYFDSCERLNKGKLILTEIFPSVQKHDI